MRECISDAMKRLLAVDKSDLSDTDQNVDTWWQVVHVEDQESSHLKCKLLMQLTSSDPSSPVSISPGKCYVKDKKFNFIQVSSEEAEFGQVGELSPASALACKPKDAKLVDKAIEDFLKILRAHYQPSWLPTA